MQIYAISISIIGFGMFWMLLVIICNGSCTCNILEKPGTISWDFHGRAVNFNVPLIGVFAQQWLWQCNRLCSSWTCSSWRVHSGMIGEHFYRRDMIGKGYRGIPQLDVDLHQKKVGKIQLGALNRCVLAQSLVLSPDAAFLGSSLRIFEHFRCVRAIQLHGERLFLRWGETVLKPGGAKSGACFLDQLCSGFG